MNGIITQATIDDIVAYRNEALALYETAWQKMAEAREAIDKAHAKAKQAAPFGAGYGEHLEETKKTFYEALRLPDMVDYATCAKRITDTDCWDHIIARMGLDMLLDTQAKKELRWQMMETRPVKHNGYHGAGGTYVTADEQGRIKPMPEITAENVKATVEGFMLNSGEMFRRGLVNSFKRLDRRFRSHDGFKIGSRVIYTSFIGYSGSVNYGGTRDTIMDIERVFAALDGATKTLSYASLVEVIRRERSALHGAHQSQHEGAYFRVKIYKNGHAHLWFTRRDLLLKVNKILADYYGEVIGDSQTKAADPLADKKRSLAKAFGFYPTPDALADNLLAHFRVEGLRVLEPSAGTGNLAYRAARKGAAVDCVEVQAPFARQLEQSRVFGRVYAMDFLDLSPQVTGLYDCVIMNPPFDMERDIDHVTHALTFLKPGGRLLAIMSAGTEFRETKKSAAFRALVAKHRGSMRDLPDGSFASVGTNVNTITLHMTL